MPQSNFSQRLDEAFQLVQEGQIENAKTLCANLRDETPRHPLLAFLNGAIAIKSARPIDAVKFLREAISLDPKVAEFHKTLGEVLVGQGELDQATKAFGQAEDIAPDRTDVRYALARGLQRQGALHDALAKFGQIPPTAAEHANAEFERAKILHDLNDPIALDLLQNVSDRNGNGLFAVTQAIWKLPVIPKLADELASRHAAYEAEIAELSTTGATIPLDDILKAGTNFFAAYQGAEDRPSQEHVAAYYRKTCPELNFTAPKLGSENREKIVIGFVSMNLNNHTVGKLYRGIIASLNRDQFDVRVFAGSPANDEISRFIAEKCDVYQMLPKTLRDAREMLAAARLDIIFYPDIGMDPLTYFLAFARLAPVQCVGWGHPVTTGLDTVDYFLSARDLEDDDEAAAQSHYTETVWRLRHPPVYLYPTRSMTPDDIPDLSFAQGKTIYCCPQALFKIHPSFDPLLRRILESDQNGIAIFIEGLPGWSEILRTRWRNAGIDLDDHIVFLPRLGQASFLALLKESHVILDTPYYSGGLSSAEALSLGKSIVTWPNVARLFARTTFAYYHQIGVSDCIANNPREYVDLALRLGTDDEFREAVEAQINANKYKLFQREEVIDELCDLLVGAVETKRKAHGQ